MCNYDTEWYVCVCEREREREKERDTERERQRETDRQTGPLSVVPWWRKCVGLCAISLYQKICGCPCALLYRWHVTMSGTETAGEV